MDVASGLADSRWNVRPSASSTRLVDECPTDTAARAQGGAVASHSGMSIPACARKMPASKQATVIASQ